MSVSYEERGRVFGVAFLSRRHVRVGVVDAETAVTTAKRVTDSPAAQLGVVARVIITDGGDFTCFEWRAGEGVTFPPRGTEGRAP
jgi:hypothetical protein